MLTQKQKEAISKTSGPCIILAGAGTGKTYTIVEKIKYIITKKVYPPEKIVCITFSNEACNSLIKKIRKSLPEDSEEPIIKTFHAFSADLIRKHGEKIGIKKEFNILEPNEAKVVLHKNLKIPGGNCHKYINSIGIAKDLGITLEKLESHLEKEMDFYKDIELEKRLESLQFELHTLHLKKEKEGKKQLIEEALKIKALIDLKKFINSWRAYEKIKKIKNYQDYSDLNKNALKLLKENKEIAEEFSYFVVDEFQDTNKIQLDLLVSLTPHKNITIVGDLNQSIYRFRGAYKQNYSEFKEIFNVSAQSIFTLDQSYRSPNKILKIAYNLILNNYKNKEECFEVKNAFDIAGENIKVFELKDSKEEARKVIELIENQLNCATPLEEICVMFRTHQQGRIIKRLLEFKQIPYCSATKNSLLKQKSVRKAIDYLTILNNLKIKKKGGEQAWWDLIYQIGFTEIDLIKIGKFIRKNKETENLNAKILNNLENVDLSEEGKIKIKILLEKIKKLIPYTKERVPNLLLEIYKISGVLEKDKENKEINANLNKLLDLSKNHSALHTPDLESFIYYLEIINSLNIEIEAAKLEQRGVRLMTLHATKGLEYDTVIITNLAQKRFPTIRSKNETLIPLELYPDLNELSKTIPKENMKCYLNEYEKENQLLEERRLCYVAFTRAKKNLILTYANAYSNKKYNPSQFLSEINYNKNINIIFSIDNEIKYKEPKLKTKIATEIKSALRKGNFEEIITNKKIKKTIQEKITFSPSSLLLFENCQKKYEYKYKYNMPEEKIVSWEVIRLGNFVHLVLEKGVNSKFKELKDFINLAKELYATDDWDSIEFEEASHLIKVFYERNKYKYNKNSKTEQKLTTELEGLKFIGFADRIDFSSKGLEIIDYKTGSSQIPPKNRNWQLGFYALAAQKLGKVHKITLDMLKHEKPLEFLLDEEGNAKSEYGRMEFNINDVKEELVKTAKQILEAKEKGFKPCPLEKNCEFCNEYFYN